MSAAASPAGPFEVELKFALADTDRLLADLQRHGAAEVGCLMQCDQYFQHPSRDLRASGEAFRLRRSGDANCLTYKGPRVDPRTKTRRELELPLEQGDAAARLAWELLTALGFAPAGEVQKSRTVWKLDWRGREFSVCIDNVAGLGEYLELETLAGTDELPAARDDLLALADELRLQNPEHRSYLSLLQTAEHRAEGPHGETT